MKKCVDSRCYGCRDRGKKYVLETGPETGMVTAEMLYCENEDCVVYPGATLENRVIPETEEQPEPEKEKAPAEAEDKPKKPAAKKKAK